MAYNGKFVSLQTIIEKAYRDSGEDYIDWEKGIEWTGDLIGLIGVPGGYVNKITDGSIDNYDPLEVINFRTELPKDLESLISIRKVNLKEDGTVDSFSEMIESTDVFFLDPKDVQTGHPTVTNPVFNTVTIDQDTDEITPVQLTQEYSKPLYDRKYTYKLEGNYIFTNFESGYIQMSYKGFAMDAEGFPMIPDDPKYREAVSWNIISHIDYIKWRKNPSPQNASIKNDSEQKRDWYVASARTKYHIPTLDSLESIKNSWLRSIEKVTSHADGFKTNNYPERRYTHNRKRYAI